MWIRTQSKSALVNCIDIERFEGKLIGSSPSKNIVLGEYKTVERAIEVLDMIETRLMRGSVLDEIKGGTRITKDIVFQMPKA